MMDFNRIAPYFERLEKIVFNNQMECCRTAFLPELPSVKKVALIGEGDGRFLVELLKDGKFEKVHYIDSSQKMLELARKRMQKFSPDTLRNVGFYHRDLISEPMPDQNYDLVVTNFFLDVFDEHSLNESISKIAASCKRTAIWLYADFQVSGGILQRAKAFAWIKVMYVFFRVAAQIQSQRLIDPSKILESNGFQLKTMKEFHRGLMKTELRQRI